MSMDENVELNKQIKIAVGLPAFNEEENIGKIIAVIK